MPELPEVETIRRDLLTLVAGQRLQGLSVHERVHLLKNATEAELTDRLTGRALETVEREGKYLVFRFGAESMVLHLRMSGRLLTQAADHTRMTLTFDRTRLYFDDARRFGMLFLSTTERLHQLEPLGKLGLEPFSDGYTLNAFRSLLGSSQEIKRLLLDQHKIAGLGNIYACEALHDARVHPERPASSLRPAESRALHAAIPEVLQRAIDAGGTSFRSYETPSGELGHFQAEFAVYGRKGDPCDQCDTPIERIDQGGRSSFLCPRCQR
ncbi:MAG: bifunctional DNA-formamidopyrimidine glycosylase/DNA-(apurinic or apyrimidinic site) lyase [Candidatus Bipolaricaulia bacterium]